MTQKLYKFSLLERQTSKNILKIWNQTIIEKKIAYTMFFWFPYVQQSRGKRLLFSIQRLCLLLKRAHIKLFLRQHSKI